MPLAIAKSGKRRSAIFVHLFVSGRSRATTRYNITNGVFHKQPEPFHDCRQDIFGRLQAIGIIRRLAC